MPEEKVKSFLHIILLFYCEKKNEFYLIIEACGARDTFPIAGFLSRLIIFRNTAVRIRFIDLDGGSSCDVLDGEVQGQFDLECSLAASQVQPVRRHDRFPGSPSTMPNAIDRSCSLPRRRPQIELSACMLFIVRSNREASAATLTLSSARNNAGWIEVVRSRAK